MTYQICEVPRQQFCETCRCKEQGKAFRSVAAREYGIGDVDFACPKGKPWIAPASRGLGDTIAKITKAVGIKPCGGCKARQAKLNTLVPYKVDKGPA